MVPFFWPSGNKRHHSLKRRYHPTWMILSHIIFKIVVNKFDYNMNNQDATLKMFLSINEKISSIEKQVRQLSLKERNPLGDIYLDTDEVCEVLKICKRTLQKHRDEASIAYIQFGGKTLYKKTDIQDLLEKHYQHAIS
jgi:excisionase family DNA binding protein